jgi:exodeoxyribonuclease VII small subunit
MAKSATPVSIEDHFRSIEEAVNALEGGELPLEDSLARYEAGLKAVRAAKQMLDRYAARLTELRGDDEQSVAPAGTSA